MADSATTAAAPRLKRVLTLWDLIFYGIVLIQPIAPVPLYGVAQDLSQGHFVTIILIAMFAMMITAFSYGRMAALYPAAGSAYTYVGKGLNPHLGFLAGWAMFLDYLLQPLINTVWISVYIHERYVHQVPFVVWAAIVTGIVTLLNLSGIRASARANKVLLAAMCVVIVAFVVLAVRFLFLGEGWSGLFSTQPFYDPKTFDSHKIWMATSFAALTYIGFDGVTTLAEDVENPKRNVLLATVLVCVFTGVFGGLEVYLGARVWPNWHTFPNLETAFMDICRRVGGAVLFHSMGAIIALAAFGSALTGGLGAARLLFGMGRDNVLPRRLFGHLSPKSNTPTYNIILIGVLAFGGAVGLNSIGNAYEHAGELLNFGAFLAFMGVNFTAYWQFTVIPGRGNTRTRLAESIVLLIGFFICWSMWLSLRSWFAQYHWSTLPGVIFFVSALCAAALTGILIVLALIWLALKKFRVLAEAVLFLVTLVFCVWIWRHQTNFARTLEGLLLAMGLTVLFAKKPRIALDAVLPLFGFVFCAVIWSNLNPIAWWVGAAWFVIGGSYLAAKTRLFRERPVMIDFGES